MCDDFVDGEPSSRVWRRQDCLDVWTKWQNTYSTNFKRMSLNREIVRDSVQLLKQQGSNCVVRSTPVRDGAGSSTIRSIVAWIFAEDMGCQWVAPAWASVHQGRNGSAVYCHSRSPRLEREKMTREELIASRIDTCTRVDWQQYFCLDSISAEVSPDATNRTKIIQVGLEGHASRLSNHCVVCFLY